MNGYRRVRLGPIRPEHVGDGWRLEGDEAGGWWLSKRVGDMVSRVHGTSPTTCAWGIYRPDGRMIREASALEVQDAKAAADDWIRERS